MTKLRNDKTDLLTLLSLQNWPQTSLIPKTICPETPNDLRDTNRFNSDVLKNANDEIKAVQRLT